MAGFPFSILLGGFSVIKVTTWILETATECPPPAILLLFLRLLPKFDGASSIGAGISLGFESVYCDDDGPIVREHVDSSKVLRIVCRECNVAVAVQKRCNISRFPSRLTRSDDQPDVTFRV
jgi:hypothetical protein